MEWLLAALAVLAGLTAWVFYFRHDLVLSHYDAKAHLVVARRVFDSLTPGWRQIGAVWLPLPHLVHLLPTQVDVLYRTGAFGSLVSIVCLGVSVWASARLIRVATGSQVGAVTSGLLLVLNPNLLYLHTTPMTEPLLLAMTFLAVLWLYEWLSLAPEPPADVPARLGWALFAAAWTRYEAWPVICAALVVSAFTMRRSGLPRRAVAIRVWRMGLWPGVAAIVFLIMSYLTVGSWFVSDGFYVPDRTYEGQAWRTLVALWWGTHRLDGYGVEIVALVAAGVLTLRGLVRRTDAYELLPIALFAAAALPFVAFYGGHPFRMRYMVPLAAICAVFAGLAVGLVDRRLDNGRPNQREQGNASLRRASLYTVPVAMILIASALIESPPWKRDAPLLQEAQWDVPLSRERRSVTECLAEYRGEKVLVSMGSLAHYMQELSQAGFRIADFVHEGNGSIWDLALETGPASHVGWMLVEEEAEDGDVLAQRIRRDATFARGMQRVCEGGGVALYKRDRVSSGIDRPRTELPR